MGIDGFDAAAIQSDQKEEREPFEAYEGPTEGPWLPLRAKAIKKEFRGLPLIAAKGAGNPETSKGAPRQRFESFVQQGAMPMSSGRSIAVASSFALAVLLLAGCEYHFSGRTGDPGPGVSTCSGFGCPGDSCASTSTCNAECSCRSGTCASQQTCMANSDCANGLSCIHGVCHPGCVTNTDCHSGESCRSGACEKLPNDVQTCSWSADCSDRRATCINGACRVPCVKNVDCSGGNVCVNMYCVAPTNPTPKPDAGTPKPDAGTSNPGGSCTFNSDCGGGCYCINATCYLGCVNDTECPLTESCQQGICRPRPSTGACKVATDCTAGNDCVNGKCSKGCKDDVDCGGGGSTCKIGYCTSPSSCTSNCDCPTGQRCLSNVCQP